MSTLQQKAASSFTLTVLASVLSIALSYVVASTDPAPPKPAYTAAPKAKEVPPPTPQEAQPTMASVLDPVSVAKGKQNYEMFCLACHGAEDTTVVSPSNLFDPQWHHGAGREGVEKSIRTGIMEKGMPGWEAMIPEEDIIALVDYLFSFQKI